MRKLLRVASTALLVITSIGVTGGPASAEASEWGFVDPPTIAHPGATIRASIAPLTRWDAFRRGEGGSLTSLVRASDACEASAVFSAEALDALGRVRSTPHPAAPDLASRFYIVLSPSAATGIHWLRVQCTQGETTPELVVVCVRFEVDPARPPAGGTVPADLSSSLVSNRCPAQGVGRILSSMTLDTIREALGLLADTVVGNGFGGVGPSTSSTTRPSGSPGGTGVPGGGNGKSDISPPDVTSVDVSADKSCNVSVSASVLDDVGVSSATVSWSGAPGSGGPDAMKDEGGTWSATIPAKALLGGKGTLTVMVTAHDAAGNKGSGFGSVDLDPGLC